MHPICGVLRMEGGSRDTDFLHSERDVHLYRWTATLAATDLLALGAAACGDDDDTTGAGSASQPEPVAQVDALSGRKTEVALDAGFVEALGTLKLTPAAVGDGKISSSGVARFPITGGNVTYDEPGSVSPFVQARSITTEAGSA
jgi:hypothetical protein